MVTPYVQACLIRSQGLPLSIDLNLHGLPGLQEYLNSRIRTSLEGIVDDALIKAAQAPLRRRIPSIIGSWRYNYQFISLIVADIKRWRHLSLLLPKHNKDSEGALLKDLSLQDTRLTAFDLGYDSSQHNDRFPNISGMKCINVARMLISSFNGSPRSLEDVQISPLLSLHLKDLNFCTSLRKLTISIFDFDKTTDGLTLSLPRLKDLTLIGYLNPLVSMIFDFPVLDRLEIRKQDEWRNRRWPGPVRRLMIPMGLPRISSRRVVWELSLWDRIVFLDGIPFILSLSTETELVTVIVRGGVEAVLEVHGKSLPLKVKHITANSGKGREDERSLVKWFKKWARENSCSFKDDSIV